MVERWFGMRSLAQPAGILAAGGAMFASAGLGAQPELPVVGSWQVSLQVFAIVLYVLTAFCVFGAVALAVGACADALGKPEHREDEQKARAASPRPRRTPHYGV